MTHRALNDLSAYLNKYDYTAYLSRRDWAYEHIRRNERFEEIAWRAQDGAVSSKTTEWPNITLLKMNRPQPQAEAWGLKFFPNPGLAAPKAQVFWTGAAHQHRIQIKVSHRSPGEVDQIFEQTVAKCEVLVLRDWEGFEHLMLRGRACSVQARCYGLSLLSTDPVKMSFDVQNFDDHEHHARVLQESKSVYGDQVTEPIVFSRKAMLLRNGLIALDGHRAGLTDREVACIIEGRDRVEAALAKSDRSLVKRVRTYRENALALINGGYRDLLSR